jgi:hypothetical protein
MAATVTRERSGRSPPASVAGPSVRWPRVQLGGCGDRARVRVSRPSRTLEPWRHIAELAATRSVLAASRSTIATGEDAF